MEHTSYNDSKAGLKVSVVHDKESNKDAYSVNLHTCQETPSQ
jgi:hypothetical protein